MTQSKPWIWNKVQNQYWENPDDEFFPIMIRWQKKGFKSVLDLGCGIGRHSIFLAKNGFKVSAFDLASDGIEQLQEKIHQSSLDIDVRVGDMLKLPYSEHTFDCLLAFHTIYHTDMEGLKKTLTSIQRIVKPGGEIFITLNSKANDSWKKNAALRINDHTLIKTEEAEVNVPHTYLSYKETIDLLKQFEIIKIKQVFNYWNNNKYAHFFILMRG